jgi:hypothetical protein
VTVDTAVLLAVDSDSELVPLGENLIAASQPYVGRWSRLVSTTNWEKGRIIVQWREALVAQGVAAAEYADETWGRLVGGVTGQHVGRLRRVFQRFGAGAANYPGLFWSHFQAANDWDDAEMWLEGAKQSGWSVAEMRDQRWQTMGQLASDRPRVGDVVTSETDEDAESARNQKPAISGEYSEVSGPRHEGPDFGDDRSSGQPVNLPYDPARQESMGAVAELVRPFENLPELPDDLAEAFDSMKLAILHHKRDEWSGIAAGDVLVTLDALKALVTAPSDDAPF